MTPPNMMTMRGPYLSTNQASIGTSQVSVTTKMVKASWIAARPQWCAASIGSTNSVQPYCRLAIIAMQTMPMTELEPTETGAKRRGCDGAIRAGNHQEPPKRLSGSTPIAR